MAEGSLAGGLRSRLVALDCRVSAYTRSQEACRRLGPVAGAKPTMPAAGRPAGHGRGAPARRHWGCAGGAVRACRSRGGGRRRRRRLGSRGWRRRRSALRGRREGTAESGPRSDGQAHVSAVGSPRNLGPPQKVRPGTWRLGGGNPLEPKWLEPKWLRLLFYMPSTKY